MLTLAGRFDEFRKQSKLLPGRKKEAQRADDPVLRASQKPVVYGWHGWQQPDHISQSCC